jgi:signal transduction histidine kinase
MLALLDAVSISLFAVDGHGRIAYANRAALLLAGMEAKRLVDICCLGPDAAAALIALPAGGRRLLSLADGRTVLARAGTFATPEGQLQRLLSLQLLTGDLDAVQVGAWHAMSQVLAHEMMNSLTPIASLSESLQRLIAVPNSVRPEIASAIDTVARRSGHLLRFVERYRAVADLPTPQFTKIDLVGLLEASGNLMRAQLQNQNTRFELALPLGHPVLRADAELLEQALLNLLTNAAEAVTALDDGCVTLSCSVGRDEISIEVRDNGCGVPNEQIEEIFVPFYTTKAGGSGIGLSLVRQIALAHGGRVDATPSPSRGMTFTLHLPYRAIQQN